MFTVDPQALAVARANAARRDAAQRAKREADHRDDHIREQRAIVKACQTGSMVDVGRAVADAEFGDWLRSL
jgi:hypothetical protein